MEERKKVFDWLREFNSDPNGYFVLDCEQKVFKEYRNNVGSDDYGMRVLYDKLDRSKVLYHPLEFDANGFALVPECFGAFDRSDRKFVALCLREREHDRDTPVVNACDSDWYEHRELMSSQGVRVVELLDDYVQKRVDRRR